MAQESRTWYPTAEHSIARTSGGTNSGSGKDDHAPIGTYSGWEWRELIKFAHDWSGWTGAKFVKAEMKVKTTGTVHVAFGSTPRCNVGRLLGSFDSTHTGGGENSWGSTYGTVWPGPSASAGIDMASHSDVSGTVVTWDISDTFEPLLPASVLKRDGSAGAGGTNHGFRIMSFDEASTSRTTEFYSDRGSYRPRIIVTMEVEDTPGAPTLGEPTGVKATEPTNYLATASGTPTKYDFQLDTDATFATPLVFDTNQTVGISGSSINHPRATIGVPSGVPVHWRMRTANSLGVYGPWTVASYSVSVVPTAVIVAPAAGGLSYIHNLGEAAAWTDAGLHAKPRVQATYNHAGGVAGTSMRVSMYTTSDVLVFAQDFPGTYLPGVTYFFNLDAPRARSATVNFKVAVTPTAGATVGVETAKVSTRMQWGQGQYTTPVGAATSDWRWEQGALAGGGASVAFLYRGRGAVTDPWKTSIGAVTKETNLDVLVRLSTTNANPTLPDMKALWSSSADILPDHWSVLNGTLILDSNTRRYGVKSMKAVSTVGQVCRLTPWSSAPGKGLLVSSGTTYTWSTYINTMGLALPDWVMLAVFAADLTTVLWSAPVGPNVNGATKNSAAAPEGWQRLWTTFTTPENTKEVFPAILFGGTTAQELRLDGHQMEEGTFASGWRPGLVGQSVVVDIGGLAVDARAGGTFRLRGSDPSAANVRSVTELGTDGLVIGGATNPVHVHSPQANVLHVGAPRLAQVAAPATPPAATGILYLSTAPALRLKLPDGSDTAIGGGTHPDLATHDALGLATQAELDAEKRMSSLYRNEATTQSVPTGTASLTQVTLTAGGVSLDPHGFFDFANNQLVVPSGKAGWFMVTFEGEWAANATGARRVAIRKNTANSVQTFMGATTNQPVTLPISLVDYLDVGDIINFYVAQSSGGNLILQKKAFALFRL